MNKIIKRVLITLAVLVGIIAVDTIQAKVFDNKPIIGITENYNGGKLYKKHKGVLVDSYVFTNGIQITYFKWE